LAIILRKERGCASFVTDFPAGQHKSRSQSPTLLPIFIAAARFSRSAAFHQPFFCFLNAMKIRAFFNEVECESLEYLGGTEELTLPLPGEIESGICKLKFAVPLKDIQQYWLPRTEGLCNRLSWTFEHRCGAQSGFPLVSFSSRDGYNRFTFGLDDLVDDTRIYAEINQAECTYDITIEIACCNETREIRLYLDDDAEMLWTASIEQYRLWLEHRMVFQPKEFPEAAWQPVFCTWYAVHGAVDASWVERIAPRARSLGFGTLIVDDGWCYPEYKRLSPETLPSWYQDIGDWQVDATKFPDMPAHVKRVKAMGLNYLVWTTAMLWGKNSRRLQEHPEAVTARPEDCGCRQFDVRHEEVGEEIAERLGAPQIDPGRDDLAEDVPLGERRFRRRDHAQRDQPGSRRREGLRAGIGLHQVPVAGDHRRAERRPRDGRDGGGEERGLRAKRRVLRFRRHGARLLALSADFRERLRPRALLPCEGVG